MLDRTTSDRLVPASVVDAKEESGGFDLHETLHFLWRQWTFILTIVGVSLVIAAVYLARETPRYTATVQVLLDPRKEKAAGTDAIMSDFGLDVANIESQMAIIRSTTFLR